MSKARTFPCTFLFILLSLLIPHISCHIHESNETRVVMFVFGDSLYDPGNNNFLEIVENGKADRWPYGETFFHFPTGRFSDGRMISDFLAIDLDLPLWKPYLGPNGTNIRSLKNGANFASGGACVLYSNHSVIDLPEQVEFFKNVANELKENLGEAEANKTLMEALYLMSIGGVDYDHFYVENTNSTESQRQQFIELVIGNFTNSIQEIYQIGGRKFALQNMGPMGCMPKIKQYFGLYGTDKCVETLLDMAKQHNVALLEAVRFLESTLDGLKYSVFDYYSTLYDIIENHTTYGFEVADFPCCGPEIGSTCGFAPYTLCNNVSEYVFFDAFHPTERVYEILSELMWHGGPTVAVPRNFKQLLELNITENARIGITNDVAGLQVS